MVKITQQQTAWLVAVALSLLVLKKKAPSFFASFVSNYRSVFICIFLLPTSALYEVFWQLRNRLIGWNNTEAHTVKVKDVQSQVLRWRKSGSSKKMCTARPAWQTMSQKDSNFKQSCERISVNLYDIITVDVRNQTVKVEPLVTMGQVTAKLIPMGWTLAVVPELDDLTVGGLLMGFGIETSSHKYGLFQDICVSYEVVLADGSVVTATANNEHQDLFRALPWSYGTLGFLVSAELKIIPAKKWVELTYHPAHSKEEALALFERFSMDQNPPEFVEGIIFSANDAVVMTGNLTDYAEPNKVNSIDLWFKPWFYEHVRTRLNSKPSNKEGDRLTVENKVVEYIPLRAYYHRHTRSLFWEMEHIVSFGNHPVFRWLLGWMIPPKVSFLKMTQTDYLRKLFNENFVFQDMLVPLDRLGHVWTFFDQNYEVYPIWLCPHRVYNTGKYQGFLQPSDQSTKDFQMFVDVGVYGRPKKTFKYLEDMPKMEGKVREEKGYQALYAFSYMTREEFREMFHHNLYDSMRKKYNAEDAFPELYEKICDRKH